MKWAQTDSIAKVAYVGGNNDFTCTPMTVFHARSIRSTVFFIAVMTIR